MIVSLYVDKMEFTENNDRNKKKKSSLFAAIIWILITITVDATSHSIGKNVLLHIVHIQFFYQMKPGNERTWKMYLN